MLILVTGGSRSGKSSFALDMALTFDEPRTFIATAQAFDDEMRARIAKHARSRSPDWRLLEEPLRVPEALSVALRDARAVLVDCVTLWMSNLLLADEAFQEEQAGEQAADLARRAHAADATTVVVTNEVGSGIVPDNPLARRFRDCAGRANQEIARLADAVYLMTSGISLRIK